MSEQDSFGHSLALVDGDLRFEQGQLTTVSGQANLLQALQLRVLTPYGTDVFNVTYGLDIQDAFVQPNSISMVKELIKLNLVRTLGTDPRVTDVRDVLFEDDPAFQARHPEISPQEVIDHKHARFWNVEVILDIVNQGSQNLLVQVGV